NEKRQGSVMLAPAVWLVPPQHQSPGSLEEGHHRRRFHQIGSELLTRQLLVALMVAQGYIRVDRLAPVGRGPPPIFLDVGRHIEDRPGVVMVGVYADVVEVDVALDVLPQLCVSSMGGGQLLRALADEAP